MAFSVMSACGSGRGGGHHGDRGRGRGLCRVTVTVPVKLGRSPRVVVHLAPCCPSPSPRTIQDTQVSRVLIFPSPFRAPVCPHLPLSVCSLLASLHAPCPSKSADHRSTLRLAGRHYPPLLRLVPRADTCALPLSSALAPSRGLTALPTDAFACSFASFPRVRSVTCTILT